MSDMVEEEIMAEIRSVFSGPMKNDIAFPFVLLQRSGPGSNALTIPSISSSFVWTAKEMVRMAGQGCLYIKAEAELEGEADDKVLFVFCMPCNSLRIIH